MAEFAQPAAPIRRLFFRVDLAAQPQSLALRRVLKHWQSQRGADVYPSQDMLDADAFGPDRGHVFAFDRAEDDDLRLRFGGKVLNDLLGPIAQGDLLSKLKARRSAARLRRLFTLIELRGEPLVAGFEARLPDGRAVDVEILVAPTSGDHLTIDSVFGALTLTATPDASPLPDDD